MLQSGTESESIVSRRKGKMLPSPPLPIPPPAASRDPEVACRIPAPASLSGVTPQWTALPQDGVEDGFATVDAAADHAAGFGVAHALPLLGLLQPAHAVR